jgi:VanZ family protein
MMELAGAARRLADRIRQFPVLVGLILLGATMIYATASLWPLNWSPPRIVTNGATWTDDGTLRFETPGLAVSEQPPQWLEQAKATGRFEVEVRARAFLPEQRGPARIFTLSKNPHEYDLFLGQRGQHLIMRLYRTCRRLTAIALPCETVGLARGVLGKGEWVDIAVEIMPGRVELRVDGVLQLERPLTEDPLHIWDSAVRIGLGNEVLGNRPWLGEIASVKVRLADDERDLLDPTQLDLPRAYWYLDREPRLVPFLATNRRDAFNNLILYMPFGALLAWLGVIRGRFAVLGALALVGAVSLVIEIAQLFFSTRNPSTTDVILNAGGGAIGFALIHRFERWTRRRLEPVE